MEKLLKKIIDWINHIIRDKLKIRNEDISYYVTIGISLVLFVVALNVFIEISEELFEDNLDLVDNTVSTFIQSFRNHSLTVYFKSVTALGERPAYIIFCVSLAIYFVIQHKTWKFILQTVVVLLLASASNMALKTVFGRSRPAFEHMVEVTSLSYPSGHAMSATSFYGFLIYLAIILIPQRWLKIAVSVVLSVIVLSIGTSRIYLGVHYPSDVAAGVVGGVIWITLCIIVFDTINFIRKKRRIHKQQ
jgi:membrane-associated phospholipid phosphatase